MSLAGVYTSLVGDSISASAAGTAAGMAQVRFHVFWSRPHSRLLFSADLPHSGDYQLEIWPSGHSLGVLRLRCARHLRGYQVSQSFHAPSEYHRRCLRSGYPPAPRTEVGDCILTHPTQQDGRARTGAQQVARGCSCHRKACILQIRGHRRV